MTRSARWAVGGVIATVLLLVAAVSGLVAGVGAAQLRDDTWVNFSEPSPDEMFVDPVTVQAEVLDVDGESVANGGWASVDVRFERPDGSDEVAFVDLGAQNANTEPLPEVGDTIEVVYERGEPGYVLRADDPMLTGTSPEPGTSVEFGTSAEFGTPQSVEQQRETAAALVRRMGLLAVSSLVLAGIAVMGAAVAVRRAPKEEPLISVA